MTAGLKRDSRVVYGAACSWWGLIDEVSTVGKMRGGDSTIPACPKCGGVLMEVENLREWWDGAQRYEDDGHPGYVEFLRWDRGRCYPTLAEARAAFARHEAESEATE